MQIKDLHQWYRSLDFLIENKDSVEKDLFESNKDLFNQEIDVVLMDTTSLVYFGDGGKAEGILDYGYSKQKRRLIVCFNQEDAIKDRKKREEIINRLIIKLKTQGLKSLLIHKEYSKYLRIKADKPELNEEEIKSEQLFDWKFVLQTNTKLNWKEVIVSYKDLWMVEAGCSTNSH